MLDWDHARIFLAVARSGQLLAAAHHLGLDHATVSRRINALETSLGAKLFERRTTGCTLTPAGTRFRGAAERIEAEMLHAEAAVSGEDVQISGTVRIGAPDGFGTYFLAERFGALLRRHPGLTLQLVPLPRQFSLSRREADLAVTIEPPSEGRLSVKKLTDYHLGLYASAEYLSAHDPIETPEALGAHRIVTYVRDLLFSEALDYLGEMGIAAAARFECASVIGQLEAVRAGIGIGVLHDYAARRYGDLVPVLPGLGATRSYWLVTHEDMREFARVRAVHDFIVAEVAKDRRSFS